MKLDYSNLQKGYALMRVAELMAIAKVALGIEAAAYVSIGCGAGYDFQAMVDVYKEIPMLGFDHNDLADDNRYPLVEFHKEPIFIKRMRGDILRDSGDFTQPVSNKISSFVSKFPGRVLFYTDNGNKRGEMKQLLKWAKPWDVIGTHDWGDSPDHKTVIGSHAQVEEKDCGFLYSAGFEALPIVNEWLTDNRCMQKFWVKSPLR